MADARATKRRVARFTTNRLVNPPVRAAIRAGLWPKANALLETTGRKSGLPRQTPVGDGLRGGEVWVVTEHGHAADYVKNIKANPNVRVKVGRKWYVGVAEILEPDDPLERMRWLKRPVNDSMLRMVSTERLVIRVKLETQPS